MTVRNQSSGFTLIELMVTITVLAILLVLALPSFSRFLEKAHLRGAADSLADQMALARSEAVRSDRNVTLKIFSSNPEVWCSGARQFQISGGTEGLTEASGSAQCDCSKTPEECLVAGKSSVVDATSFKAVSMTAGDGTVLEFDRKNGTLEDLTPTTIALRSKEHPDLFGLNVVTSPLGHSRVCIPTGYVPFGSYKPCG